MIKTPKKSKPKAKTESLIKPGSILIGNDNIFDHYNKSCRRLVVNGKKRGHINVSKIHTIQGKEDKVKSGKLVPLEDNYKSLQKPSAASVYSLRKDVNGKKLKANDKRFVYTGEELSPNDKVRLKKGRMEYFKKVAKKKEKAKKKETEKKKRKKKDVNKKWSTTRG